MTIHNTIANTADNLCMMNRTSVTDVGDHENQHTLTTIYNDNGMSHEMEETMSEEAEVINVPLTDRDTAMGNITTKSVTHKKEGAESIIDKSHVDGFTRVRTMDGDTVRVVRDAKKKCFNIMFEEEATAPVNYEVNECTSRTLKMLRKEPVDELFSPKNVKTSTPQPPNTKSSKVRAKHIKKAAKKIRQKETKSGIVTTMRDIWQLECTNTSCTAGVGGAPFKTPALSSQDAIEYLGLHREAAHVNNEMQELQMGWNDMHQPTALGLVKPTQLTQQEQQLDQIKCVVTQNATTTLTEVIGPNEDAEISAERTNCPMHPNLAAQKILQVAAKPIGVPKIPQPMKNRSKKGAIEKKQDTPVDNETGIGHIVKTVGRNDEEEYAPKEANNEVPNGTKISNNSIEARDNYKHNAGPNDELAENVDAETKNTFEDNNKEEDHYKPDRELENKSKVN